MPKVIQNEGRNPLLVVSPEEVTAWLRQIADENGLEDRAGCAVQISVRDLPNGQADVCLLAAPELAYMVSNIPQSRR